MKRKQLILGGGMTVECGRDWNGLYFTAYAREASVYTRSSKDLRRFLRLPLKTESRDSLDAWLDEVEAVVKLELVEG